MAAIDIIEKTCRDCGEDKPLSEFHRSSQTRDGRRTYCKPCTIEQVQAWKKRKRAEIGDEAFREYERRGVERSRARTGDATGRESRKAYNAALFALRDIHRDQFDRLLAAERYERGLE